MNKLAQLNREYWGRVHDMCKGTTVKPWECVRYKGKSNYSTHPFFRHFADHRYVEFAVAILEDKPVWVGDSLYSNTGRRHTVIMNGKRAVGLDVDASSEQDHYCTALGLLSFHPPKPKRTFTISVNGGDPIELPCPDPDAVYGKSFTFDISGTYFGFISSQDCDKTHNTFIKILTEARNK